MKRNMILSSALLPTLLAAVVLTGCSAETEQLSAASEQSTSMTPAERGAKLYRRCKSCHTLGNGEKHKVGPNLYGVFGSAAGSKPDFNYSKAMSQSDIIWSDETLEGYLARPSDYIPGNRMSFIGLNKPEDRAAVILYLKSQTGGS